MLQTHVFWENVENFIENTPLLFSVGLSFALVCAYYTYLFIKNKQSGYPSLIQRKEPPLNLSPAAVRYIWLSYFDSNCLLAGILNAVVKNCYRISWNKDSFYISLVNFSRLYLLSSEERAALSHSSTRYRERMKISALKNNFTDRAEIRMEKVLTRHFHSYFIRIRWIVFIGTVFSILSLLISSFLFLPDLYYPLFIYILGIFPSIGIILHSAWTSFLHKAWPKFILIGISLLAVMALMIWVEVHFSTWLFPLLIPHIVIQIIAFFKLPKYTIEGQRLRIEIEEFRNYLQSKVGKFSPLSEQEMHLLPYLIALEINFENAAYFTPFLSTYPPSKNIFSWFIS